MKMRYKIYTDKKLLIDILEGDIRLSDLEKIYNHEINDANFKYVNRIFSDITNAQLLISSVEMQKFIKYMISPNPDINFRWAILTSKPFETALSFLIKEDNYFNHIVNVFSTINASAKFLAVQIDRDYFDHDDYIVLK